MTRRGIAPNAVTLPILTTCANRRKDYESTNSLRAIEHSTTTPTATAQFACRHRNL